VFDWMRIEVAIAALMYAVWDVNVQS